MRRFIQCTVVIASTGAGVLIGRYVLVPALMVLVPHMKWLLPESGPPKHDLGDMVSVFMTVGYSLGLSIGVGMTLALLGGLLAGLALARRIKLTGPTAALNVA